ncbi:MAG: hypothetical protein AAGK21_16790 [Bacteroidota bacterium]
MPSADLPDDSLQPEAPEPSLRAHLADRWRSAPVLWRWGGVLLLLLGIGAVASPAFVEATEGPTEEELQAQAAIDRAQWAAMLRQSPATLDADPIENALGPGDAEQPDDRYADYYVHEADSVAFSVLVTSDDFAPDLAIRLPDGRTLAASSLLRTSSRAEIGGLEGPGRFEVIVTSEESRTSGTYELAVVPVQEADSVYVDGEARLDTLGQGPLRAGRYERIYGVSAGSELPVIVRVVSTEFVPRVNLLGPNGEVQASWRSLEKSSQGDSLHGVVVRYLPGWDAAYRLIVSSEDRAASGAFAIDASSIPIRRLSANGRRVQGTLGDESWVEDGRYVDSYRFRIGENVKTRVTLESEAFPPAYRLWRIERRARVDVNADTNAAAAADLRYEEELDAGEYFLEVTSGGETADRPIGGEYAIAVQTERVAPPPPSLDQPSAPETRVFSTEVRRTGQSGGSTFEVGVTNVAISYPGRQRTRVQMSITVRSVDYTGNWAPWANFSRQAYVVDDRGRRYTAAVSESQSPSGPRAEPGTARRGTVVFYLPEVAPRIERLVLVASIGERRLTLPIPVP